MPRPGPAYAITPEWRERVIARLKEMKITQNELARRAKISKSSLSEALAESSVQTTVMPQIHRALGWEPPPLALSPDALEMIDRRVPPVDRPIRRLRVRLVAGPIAFRAEAWERVARAHGLKTPEQIAHWKLNAS